MIRRLARSLPFAALALLSACSHDADDASSSEAAQTETYAPYPTTIRAGMTRLGSLDPLNANVGDFGSSVRDQGSIASCASFGFLGMIENQMFNDRGITPDLSERFMIFSNFFQTGSLGGDPKVIAQFPSLVKNLGLLTEEAYPYAAVNANGHRFEQDAAQGLQTDAHAPSLASALEGTANSSKQRSTILQRSEFLGELPRGPYPITLPLKAKLRPGAKIPELELAGKLYDCFAEGGPDSVAADKRLNVTPRELLEMCFDLDPGSYFACGFDAGQAEADATAHAQGTDDCTRAREIADGVATPMAAAHAAHLQLALSLLARGDAVFLGVTAPAGAASLPVWSSKRFERGSGHAVLAIGFVTYDELGNAAEQTRGLLGSGYFDKLAAAVEPAFAEKLAAGLPADPAALRDARLASKLGERLKTEGGLILFRNSWGAAVPGNAIGIEGHQAMTFDYFMKTAMLVQGRTQVRVPGIGWQPGAGPAYCPTTTGSLSAGGTWLQQDQSESLKAYFRALVVPATCTQ